MLHSSNQLSVVKSTVDDLRTEFGNHAYLIFAAGLLLSTGDYEQLLSDSVLDGPDDKRRLIFSTSTARPAAH